MCEFIVSLFRMKDFVFMTVTAVVVTGLALMVSWPYRVSGDSMEPSFHNGQWLIVNRISQPKVGDVVVFRFGNTELLKRIIKPVDDGWWVEGDNKDHSTDSRSFGPVPKQAVIGKLGL